MTIASDFLDLILEFNMTSEMAMEVLEIDPTQDYDLKVVYRKASLKHHPDRGGTTEMQQKVNAAYEYLQKHGTGKGTSISSRQAEREADAEEKRRKSTIVLKLLKDMFKPDVYLKYFEKYSGKTLKYSEVEKIPTGLYGDLVLLEYEFFTPDRTLVFYIQIDVSLYKVRLETSLGGGEEGATFPFYVDLHLYHDGLKQKMGKRTWDSKKNTRDLATPSKLFPVKKLTDIFAGKKKRKFKRRDFETGLNDRIGAKYHSKDTWVIPIKDELRLMIFRTTMLKVAAWHINGLYGKNKRISPIAAVSLPESLATIEFFVRLMKESKKISSESKMIDYMTAELKEYNKNAIWESHVEYGSVASDFLEKMNAL